MRAAGTRATSRRSMKTGPDAPDPFDESGQAEREDREVAGAEETGALKVGTPKLDPGWRAPERPVEKRVLGTPERETVGAAGVTMRVVAPVLVGGGEVILTGGRERNDEPTLGGVEMERDEDRVLGAGLGRETLLAEILPRLETEREPLETEIEGRLRLTEEERPW